MFETFRNIVDKWPCDYFWGGGKGGWGGEEVRWGRGWETCNTVLVLRSELSLATCGTLWMLRWTFSSNLQVSLDAMLYMLWTLSRYLWIERFKDVMTLQDLARCKMFETFYNTIRESACEYIFLVETFVCHRSFATAAAAKFGHSIPQVAQPPPSDSAPLRTDMPVSTPRPLS